MSKPIKIRNFEQNLQELEDLISAMESGDLSLEESLKHFEKGIKMTRACQEALNAAEQRVSILMEKDGEMTTEAFAAEQSDQP